MNPNALADSFTRYNPKFLSLVDVKTDTGKNSKRFLCGYYDLLERRVRRRATLLDSAIDASNSALKSFNVYSPAVQTQYLFSVISGTTRSDYKRFENEANDYRLIWRDYIYSHQLRDIYLKQEDFYEFPQFSPARPAFQFCEVLIPSISLWISGLLFLVIPFTIKNKT